MKSLVRGFKQGFEMMIRGGCLKMTLVARELANGLRGSIGQRISAGKVFKISFAVIFKFECFKQHGSLAPPSSTRTRRHGLALRLLGFVLFEALKLENDCKTDFENFSS